MTFSASQVNTFESCARKWGWIYLDKLQTPQHPSAQLGTEIHAFLEHQLLFRKQWGRFDEPWAPAAFWDLTSAGRAHWPGINFETVRVEQEFDKLSIGGHAFRGYIDATWTDDNGEVHVLDHKTTSNFRYAKKPNDLLVDVQATIYVPAALKIWKKKVSDPVHMHWVYYKTKQPYDGKRTYLVVKKADVAGRLSKIVESADKMAAALSAGCRARDMEPNWDACYMYGGCPFKSRCEVEAKVIGGNMGKATEILARLGNKADRPTEPAGKPALNPPAAASGGTSAAPTEPAPAPAPAAAPEKKEKETKRKKLTLYIDCMPTKGAGKVIDASELIDRALASLDSPHYKLEDYGKGAGLFAVALKRQIEENGTPDAMFLSLGTTEGRDACQTLVSYADNVIRGMPR